MAEKEATIFILDLGLSMGQCHSGRKESDLDWSMRYVWDKLTYIISQNRKTLNVGILGLRTDETDHILADDDGYENISVLQNLGPVTGPSLEILRSRIKVSHTSAGDAVSAVVLAVQMIENFTKHLKYTREIFLVTDARGVIDLEESGEIVKKLDESKIKLNILYDH